jgi:glutathione S-transferase
MITLYTFGPAFGLPDPSPFVTKADVLLKMAGVPYRTETGSFGKAPKGKLPYLDDDGVRVADSTFIRWHLESKYGVDFDRGLDAGQRAAAWALEKMIEDHLYWALVHVRWVDEANFWKGSAEFFRRVPAPVRPIVIALVRRQVRKTLHAQGMGRYSPEEMLRLAIRDIDAVADCLGTRPYVMGDEPSSIDATVFAFAIGILCPRFDTPIRAATARHDNLKRYVGRMAARYYPEFKGLGDHTAAS